MFHIQPIQLDIQKSNLLVCSDCLLSMSLNRLLLLRIIVRLTYLFDIRVHFASHHPTYGFGEDPILAKSPDWKTHVTS